MFGEPQGDSINGSLHEEFSVFILHERLRSVDAVKEILSYGNQPPFTLWRRFGFRRPALLFSFVKVQGNNSIMQLTVSVKDLSLAEVR